jgi:hypothetical protein
VVEVNAEVSEVTVTQEQALDDSYLITLGLDEKQRTDLRNSLVFPLVKQSIKKPLLTVLVLVGNPAWIDPEG